jgi:hypothetical protein
MLKEIGLRPDLFYGCLPARVFMRVGLPSMMIGMFLISLLCGPLHAAPSEPTIHHDLNIILYPDQHALAAKDLITAEGLEAGPCEIYLAPQTRVDAVEVGGAEVGGAKVPFRFEAGRLVVAIPSHVSPGNRTITITYTAVFEDPVPDNPVHTEDPSYGVTGAILPEGTFLLPGAGWYPDLAGGKVAFLLSVTAPAGYEAVTVGKRVARERHADVSTSRWEIQKDPKGLALSAGPYVVREREVLGTPIYTYFFAEEDSLADTYLNATTRYLRLYSERFGPYPFEKFAVVENFFPTGYGFPSYTLLGRTVVRLPFIVETSLGHEVAHSWWGNGVLVDYAQGNWCEGLTSYVADYLYEEQASAQQAQAYRMKILRDYATLVAPEQDFPLSAFMGRVSPATRVVGYGKAAMVFHMARRLTGEDNFWGALREIFQNKCFQKAAWNDFADTLGRRAGTDLKPFFSQWVTGPGAPTLRLDNVALDNTERGWQVTGSIAQEQPFYDLAVPLRLETEGSPVDMSVGLKGRSVSFSLSSPQQPRRLVVDPDTELFRRLEQTEIPATINSVKGAASLVAVASRTLSAETLEASKLLLAALGHEDTPIVTEDQAVISLNDGNDVLYLGMPTRMALSALPKDVALAQNFFRVNGKEYADPEDVLFLVVSRDRKSGKVEAVFLPRSAKAAGAVVRKISHYGKYSFVAFRNGVIEDKDTWPVTESALIHVFDKEDRSS